MVGRVPRITGVGAVRSGAAALQVVRVCGSIVAYSTWPGVLAQAVGADRADLADGTGGGVIAVAWLALG